MQTLSGYFCDLYHIKFRKQGTNPQVYIGIHLHLFHIVFSCSLNIDTDHKINRILNIFEMIYVWINDAVSIRIVVTYQ